MHSLQFRVTRLGAIVALLTLGACANLTPSSEYSSNRHVAAKQSESVDNLPLLGQLRMQRPKWFSGMIKERQYARLSRVINSNSDVVFSDQNFRGKHKAHYTLDLKPGTYTVSGVCESFGDGTKGHRKNWLSSIDVNIVADKTLTLACELYVVGEEDGPWLTSRKLLSNNIYSVRLIELDQTDN